jgi:hypothetical protein
MAVENPPASLASTPQARLATERRRYLELSQLGWPEIALMLAGPVLLFTLFSLPWFSATGYATIHGRHGMASGWQTYTVMRYFLLWCGVGAFILPWMVARRHDVGWRRGEMTAVHGLTGIALLILNGVGFPPGSPPSEIHVKVGYVVALLTLIVYVFAGAASADSHVPIPRKPPGI